MATTQTDAKSGTNHRHGLTATDKQIAALPTTAQLAAEVKARSDADIAIQAAITALTARVTKLEGGVVIPPPDIPGPLPVGTTPPKALRDKAATGADCQAELASYLASAKLLDLDGITIPAKQANQTAWKDHEVYNGILKQTSIPPSGPGTAAAFWWLHAGCADLYFHDLEIIGTLGPAPRVNEANHGFNDSGVNGLRIEHCRIHNFGGDPIYFTGDTDWCHNVKILNNTLTDCGRMGIGIADGLEDALIDGNTWDRLGWYQGVDIEPNGVTVGGKACVFRNIIITNNKHGRGNTAKYAFVMTGASNEHKAEPVVANVVVKGNRTIYPDTPWGESITGWPSAVTKSDNV